MRRITHYVAKGGPAARVSVCGVLCRAGGGPDGNDPVATSRIIYTRCRSCVMVLRAERNYLLSGARDKYGRPVETPERGPSESMMRRQEGPER